nr:MAG TPA: hypothetical protein [Caudoviricetes sp.]
MIRLWMRQVDQIKIIRTCFRWEMGSDYLFSSENSIWVSVENEIRNHRLTDISYDMISGGHKYEVRCKGLSL